MDEIINAFGDCNSGLIGSAVDPCSITSYGDLKGIILLRPGTKITAENFALSTYWQTLIQDKKAFPYLNLFNFEQTTPENETATSSTGNLRTIRDGKPQYTLTFDGNPCLVKSLRNKKGLVWDIILVFDKATVFLVNENGTISGFQASYFDVGTMTLQSGTDIQGVTAMIQLDSAEDFNANQGFVLSNVINLNRIKGAFEADLTVTAKAGTAVLVRALSACNNSVNYVGLEDPTNWKVNGVAPTAVTYNATTGLYTLTVTALVAGNPVVVVLAGTDDLNNVYVGRGETITSA